MCLVIYFSFTDLRNKKMPTESADKKSANQAETKMDNNNKQL